MWAYDSVFYHIYPLGFCGAPQANDGVVAPRILKIADWAEHIGKDISLLLRCDAIYLLDDYEKSEGARIELCIALHRRMPVFMNVRPKLGFFSVQTFEDYDKEKV